MADLVPDRGGQLRLVVEQRQQTPGHEDVVAAQGVRVRFRLIENVEFEAAVDRGPSHHALADAVDQVLQAPASVDTAPTCFSIAGGSG